MSKSKPKKSVRKFEKLVEKFPLSKTGLTMLTVLLVAVPVLMLTSVRADGVDSTVTTPSNAKINISTASDVVFTFTPDNALGASDTMVINWPSTFSSSLTATGDITASSSGGSLTVASYTLGTNSATLTFGGGPSTGAVTITIGDGTANLTSPGTAGNYAFNFTTSKGDYGAFFLYVGDSNDVDVTAQVNPSMSFAIMDSSLSGVTSSCDLGTLSLAAVSTCSYRLKVSTNSASGYEVQVKSNGGLVYGSNEIDGITDNETVTLGVEGYGVALNGGQATGGTVTEGNTAGFNFSVDDTPVPGATAKLLYSSSGLNDPDSEGTPANYTALVTHRAAIGNSTVPGTYTQTVTYYVIPHF